MNRLEEFQGLCPLCYKPVRVEQEFRTIQSADRNETYHAACLHQFIQYNSSNGQIEPSLGQSLLEQYKGLILPSPERRAAWIAQNRDEWQWTGESCKFRREEYGVALKHVAEAMGISLARLKRFEAGKPVRDAKLLLSGYVSLLYVYHLEQRLKMMTDQLIINQDDLNGALYEELYDDQSIIYRGSDYVEEN